MERGAASDGPQGLAGAPAPGGSTDSLAPDQLVVDIGSFGERFDDALGRWDQALADVLGLVGEPGLQTASDAELMGWSQQIERLSNRAPIAAQYLINAMTAANCHTDSPLGLFSSMPQFLSTLLNIRRGEANHRALIAEALAPVTEMSGHQRPIRYPLLAAAQATGQVAPSELYEAVKAMNEWEKLAPVVEEITPERLSTAEGFLADYLQTLSGTDLDKVIVHLGDYLNPDGTHHHPEVEEASRSLTFHKVRRGQRAGTWKVEGYLTDQVGQTMQAVLNPLTRPQHVLDQHDRVIEADTRSREQRVHDAFGQVMDRALRAGDLPAHGGLAASLILTCTESDYRAGTGAARHEDGTTVAMATARECTDEAEISRVVLDDLTEEPLWLERTERIASKAQTKALIVRDRGCTFPGCDRTPRWCQRHHLNAWIDGGCTDVDNLCLLCSFHHHRFANHGWTAELRDGRVWWRPPTTIDPERKPLINTAHRDPPLQI